MTHREWKAEVKKQLELRGMKRDELAEKAGYSVGYVQHVIAGDMKGGRCAEAISIVLGIEPFTE